jgi:hypothetical protein
MSSPDNHILIPVVSDLVVPGDPRLKKGAYEKMSAESAYADNLNQRINELESAIGQDEMTSLSRAYAIREEASRAKNTQFEQAVVDEKAKDQDTSDIDTEMDADSTQK